MVVELLACGPQQPNLILHHYHFRSVSQPAKWNHLEVSKAQAIKCLAHAPCGLTYGHSSQWPASWLSELLSLITWMCSLPTNVSSLFSWVCSSPFNWFWLFWASVGSSRQRNPDVCGQTGTKNTSSRMMAWSIFSSLYWPWCAPSCLSCLEVSSWHRGSGGEGKIGVHWTCPCDRTRLVV